MRVFLLTFIATLWTPRNVAIVILTLQSKNSSRAPDCMPIYPCYKFYFNSVQVQRRRGIQKLQGAGSCNFPTDEIMGAQYFQFCPQSSPKMGDFQPEFCTFGGNCSDKNKTFRQGEIRGCHDATTQLYSVVYKVLRNLSQLLSQLLFAQCPIKFFFVAISRIAQSGTVLYIVCMLVIVTINLSKCDYSCMTTSMTPS